MASSSCEIPQRKYRADTKRGEETTKYTFRGTGSE